MTVQPLTPHSGSVAAIVNNLVVNEGTASHPYCAPSLARSRDGFVCNPVDFADAVHLLSLLHGRQPGVLDFAGSHVGENEARTWLLRAMDGFARERSYLNHLVVAVGPLPSTSGQEHMASVIMQQSRALTMLAQSDRRGCALGAALALTLDWHMIRPLLDGGAARMGIDPPECHLPDLTETLAMASSIDDALAMNRAIQFGASQLLGQHRGAWDLLRARAEVRRTTS